MDKKAEEFEVCREYDSALDAQMRKVRRKIFEYNASKADDDDLRQTILSAIFYQPTNSVIAPPFKCDVGSNIVFGNDGYANCGLVILDAAPVRIGNNVLIGADVKLCAGTHPIQAKERRKPLYLGESITIGDDVWLGAGVIVLPGVTIGDRTVIGAGSVVTRNIPSDVVAIGSPCIVTRTIDQSA